MSRSLQHPRCPLVETGALAFGRLERGRMNSRIDTQHHPARGGLVGHLSEFLAGVQVVVDGLMKGLLEFADRLAMKPDDVVNIEHAPDDDLVGRPSAS